MAWRMYLKKFTLLTIFGVVLQGVYLPVFAKNVVLGEKAANSLEALKKASQYSFDNSGIGILIAHGTGNVMTADQIGEAFVKEIQKRGEKGRYYYYTIDKSGVAMEFYIGYATMGPWDSDTAASNMSKIVEMMQAAKRVHSGQVKL